jgi:hypothetical protein
MGAGIHPGQHEPWPTPILPESYTTRFLKLHDQVLQGVDRHGRTGIPVVAPASAFLAVFPVGQFPAVGGLSDPCVRRLLRSRRVLPQADAATTGAVSVRWEPASQRSADRRCGTARQVWNYLPHPPGGACLPGWICQYSQRSWQRPPGAKRSKRHPGRVISPWSGSIIVVHHSTATRSSVMIGRPASIRRCSARSRSFLPGPDGPAGAPPGQRLRSGALIELRENREQKQDPYYKVSTVRGEPRGPQFEHTLGRAGWPS